MQQLKHNCALSRFSSAMTWGQ